MIRNATAYEDDFYAWTQKQARLLRSGQIAGLDLEHLAEEIESMGSQQRREMRSRLTQANETGLPIKTFPVASPFSLAEALDPNFPPDLGVVEDGPALSRN